MDREKKIDEYTDIQTDDRHKHIQKKMSQKDGEGEKIDINSEIRCRYRERESFEMNVSYRIRQFP